MPRNFTKTDIDTSEALQHYSSRWKPPVLICTFLRCQHTEAPFDPANLVGRAPLLPSESCSALTADVNVIPENGIVMKGLKGAHELMLVIL